MSWSTGVFTAQDRRTFLSPQSYRSLTERFDFFCTLGSKLPGYYQLVPSGQKARVPVYIFDSTSLTGFEYSLPDVAFRSVVPKLCRGMKFGRTNPAALRRL